MTHLSRESEGSAYRWAYKLADDVIGEELQLVASLPAKFLGVEGGAEYVSVFSFYSRDDYFLDRITYHGDPEEMEIIKRGGATQVVFHEKGGRFLEGMSYRQEG